MADAPFLRFRVDVGGVPLIDKSMDGDELDPETVLRSWVMDLVELYGDARGGWWQVAQRMATHRPTAGGGTETGSPSP